MARRDKAACRCRAEVVDDRRAKAALLLRAGWSDDAILAELTTAFRLSAEQSLAVLETAKHTIRVIDYVLQNDAPWNSGKVVGDESESLGRRWSTCATASWHHLIDLLAPLPGGVVAGSTHRMQAVERRWPKRV